MTFIYDIYIFIKFKLIYIHFNLNESTLNIYIGHELKI